MRDVWHTDSLAAWDKAHTWHPFTQMRDWCAGDPLVLVEGDGAILRDSHGREYLDGNSSIWTNIHGHRHPAITRAIREQLDRVAHVSFLGTTNAPAAELASRLVSLFPPDSLTRVFFSDDGSTAIEAALKMTVQFWQLTGHPERRSFVAFDRAYPGDTAVVIEPLIQGAAGMRLWPSGLLRRLRDKCDASGTLLILDEVLTGFGRTGTLFACEQENVSPDFLCLAKGLTGGYLPLAATLATERIFSAFLGGFDEQKTFYYGHSYTANPLGCAAALASLDVFRDEDVLAALRPKIELLRTLLDGLKPIPHVFEVRQCGFIAGIEIRRPDGTAHPWQERTGGRICEAARAHGLLTRPVLDTLVLMPPLCTTPEQLRRATDALARSSAEVCA